MKCTRLFKTGVLWALLLGVAVGCKDDDEPEVTYDVMLNQTTAGTVLADKDGRTLYFFTKDATGESKCTSANCLTNWPVFSLSGTPRLGDGLNASDFGTITRTDGTKQVTYKGWPLYYFKDDMKKGDVLGENVGKIWFVAKTNYTIMLANNQLVGDDGKSYKADYTEGTEEVQYFVDGNGRTLYGFVNDRKNTNKYTKPDFSNDAVWPIYTTDLEEVPSELNKALFSVITVHGRKQLTYNGWPLYYFGKDNATRGMTKGVSVPRPGVWPIVQKSTPEAPAP